MALFRLVILLALLAAGAYFVLFAITSNPRYKRNGLRILLGTLAAAFLFFGVLILESLR